MINQDRQFYKEIIKILKEQGYSANILDDYHGRFFEHAKAALATNAPQAFVHSIIYKKLYDKYGEEANEIIQKLSHDQFGKKDWLYY